MMNSNLLKEFLEEKYDLYNRQEFIYNDPVLVPHSFESSEDIEIAGFFAATLAWGQRKTIINNSLILMKMMDNSPSEFIRHSKTNDLKSFESFKHRTFNGTDAIGFIDALKNIYRNFGSLKNLFERLFQETNDVKETLKRFREIFFEFPIENRIRKHVANVSKNASAKRLNMFLRWMVRKDDRGVDFGIWDMIPASALYIPLDVHSGGTARKLGLLRRNQDDWKSVDELTANLRKYDAKDPVKYDYALFGIGIYENL